MATTAQIRHLAAAMGIQMEIIQGFQNEHEGVLPKNVGELVAWGDQNFQGNPNFGPRHNRTGAFEEREGNTIPGRVAPGAWRPMRPGTNCDDYCNGTPWPDLSYWPYEQNPPAQNPATPPPATSTPPAAPAKPTPAQTIAENPTIGPTFGAIAGWVSANPLPAGAALLGAILLMGKR